MFCYFLNVRKFVSKAGKECCIFTIASPEGDVSEFFVSDEVYSAAVEKLSPFDNIELTLTANRGKFSVSGFEHVVQS